jgi:hypothetical protein
LNWQGNVVAAAVGETLHFPGPAVANEKIRHSLLWRLHKPSPLCYAAFE